MEIHYLDNENKRFLFAFAVRKIVQNYTNPIIYIKSSKIRK